MRWVWVFGVSVMEVSRERRERKKMILKEGETAVWRREVGDGVFFFFF